jgi:multimeric flavodoxin WrbA
MSRKPPVYMRMEPALKAAFLIGTLKPATEWSHTETLCELLAEELARHGCGSELIRLAEYDIPPGIQSNLGGGDEWPGLLKKVLAADILIFATPIWWGIQSSLIQRVIERMDELNEELLATGKSELANKVGGIVITGSEDGAQHIIGNLLNFMVWNGLTMPPACSLSYLGDFPETKDELMEKFRESKSTSAMAKTMARNLSFFSRLLKRNPIPQEGGGIRRDIAPGTVGMRGDVPPER